MKRSVMLRTKLVAPLDTIQMCRDIVEANFNAWQEDAYQSHEAAVAVVELQARIYTDLEILARNQTDYPESSSAAR